MVDAQAGIEVTAPVRQQHAVGVQARAVALQCDIEFVPRQRRAQLQVQPPVVGLGRQHRVGTGERGGPGRVVLHARMQQRCAAGDVHVRKRVAEVAVRAVGEVVFDQRQPGTFAQIDEVAQMPGQVGIGSGTDDDEMQRRLDPGAGIDADHEALVGQRGIDACEHLVAALEAAREEVGIARFGGLQHRRQRLHVDAAGQPGQIAVRAVETAIDEDHARCGDVREQSGIEGGRGGGRRGERAALQRAQRGVLPRFDAGVRQAGVDRGLQRGTAALAQPGGVARGQRLERAGERVEQGAHTDASGATRSFSHA
ncbi:MAG: hypothetical protein A2579_04765 [Lysobacterales bacterium RIFOXYD1_FULL_69_11]|nr:MAG: hypothetical protein A2579_04765 [Xanthomonadales bacterium RIFOXYD1_FULL_69_11]